MDPNHMKLFTTGESFLVLSSNNWCAGTLGRSGYGFISFVVKMVSISCSQGLCDAGSSLSRKVFICSSSFASGSTPLEVFSLLFSDSLDWSCSISRWPTRYLTIFYRLGGGVLRVNYNTEENSSLKVRWCCRYTRPVVKFRTNIVLLARTGDNPRRVTTLALGFHLGAPPSTNWFLCFNTKLGSPKCGHF